MIDQAVIDYHEFACRCGYRRVFWTPTGVPPGSWLADYPCPACGTINYPRVVASPVSAEVVLDQAVKSVLMTMAEPGVEAVADIAARLRLAPEVLGQALVRLRGAGLILPDPHDRGADDAAADAEFWNEEPECDQ